MLREVIAIDGPAGAGKSTVAKAVAHKLGFTYLDTGAMYRCVALLAKRNGLSTNEGDRAAELAKNAEIAFQSDDPQRVILNGEDVTAEIRTMEIGELASTLSAYSEIRKEMVKRQKAFCDAGQVVLEGRDTTTVVCPDAMLKLYLHASVEERARRRWKELEGKGDETPLDAIERQIAERDHRDMTRSDSPLKVAEGVVLIDTDKMTIEEVVGSVIEAWETALLAS